MVSVDVKHHVYLLTWVCSRHVTLYIHFTFIRRAQWRGRPGVAVGRGGGERGTEGREGSRGQERGEGVKANEPPM